MPKYLIYPLYTAVFAIILVVVVPRKEIRRLSIYGIVFGAVVDALAIVFGNVTDLYGYINYGPFGFMGIPFFPPIAWAMFYIQYFYFLPQEKPLIYVYIISGIFYSILFANMIVNLGIFSISHRLLLPLIVFSLWFPAATWGYYKLNSS